MIVAVVGSRSIISYSIVKRELDRLPYIIDTIVTGGAKGVDTSAERYADNNNLNKIIIKPDWDKYGTKAGFIRNEVIISKADFVIIIWDGKSKGTRHDIQLCHKMRKNYLLIFGR